MKYMVMECHPAYAILMDEASRLVQAANLHYEVGQIVESPVLLETAAKPAAPRLQMTVRRGIAAAACMVLLAGAGAAYYRGNYTTYSTIVVSAAADVSMDISRTGRVLAVHPLNDDAAQLLSDYDCRGKNQRTVVSELIERAVAGGYVSAGDTVYVYVDARSTADYDSCRTAMEQEIAAFDLNADVHEYQEKPQTTAPVETTVPTETTAPAATTVTTVPTETVREEMPSTVQETTVLSEEPTEKRIPRWDDSGDWQAWGSWDPWGYYGDWHHRWDDDDDDDEDAETETRYKWDDDDGMYDDYDEEDDHKREDDEDDDKKHDDDDKVESEDDDDDPDQSDDGWDDDWDYGWDDEWDDDWKTDETYATYPDMTYPYMDGTHGGWWYYPDTTEVCGIPDAADCQDPTEPAEQEIPAEETQTAEETDVT